MAKKLLWWALFVVLVLGTAALALVTVVGAVETVTGNLGQGSSRADSAIGVAVFVAGTVLVAWLARRVEHHVRTHHAAASPTSARSDSPRSSLGGGAAWERLPGSLSPGYEGPVRPGEGATESPEGQDAPPPEGHDAPPPGGDHVIAEPSLADAAEPPDAGVGEPPVGGGGGAIPPEASRTPVRPRRSVRSRRYTPHALLTRAIFSGVLAALLVVGSVLAFVGAHKSDLVQHDGIPVTATITAVNYITHSTRGGSYTTVDLEVQLPNAAPGQGMITIHTPESNPPGAVGDPIAILVDRSDRSYAELPGEPDNTTGSAVVLSVFTVLLIGLTVLQVRNYRQVKAGRPISSTMRSLGRV